MISVQKRVTITPDGIEFFIQLTDAVEMLHHTNIPRDQIIEKLAALNRRELNLVNEALREWKMELQNVEP